MRDFPELINFNDPLWKSVLRRQMLGPRIFFARILRVSRGGKLTTGLMDLIVLSDWLSNVLVEEIPDTREKRTIEVKLLVLFAEIRHVSFWQIFRNSV